MSCPYIDANIPRCSQCLNLKNIEDAFELCADQYELCPLYIELHLQQVSSAANLESDDS